LVNNCPMAKNRQIAENLVLLRMAVGAAGEDKELAWWRSAFCGSMSGACLAPIFPKTVSLAALTGVTAAACRVHDEHIGVGRVFHLFRLPEDLEQAVDRCRGQENHRSRKGEVRKRKE